MRFIKLILLCTCLSVSQSFAVSTKNRVKPFSKATDYLDEESNPKFYAAMITKILTELERATPSGYRFCQTTAVQNIINDSDEPYYIKIEKKN